MRKNEIVAMPRQPTLRLTLLYAGMCVSLSACATPETARGINDPYEATNRKNYEITIRIDKNVLRPVAMAYGGAMPARVQQGIYNFSGNFNQPQYVVNDILQGNVDDAAHNAVRFLMNTTFGILGLFDVASSAGLFTRESDFGETLHVWGAQEGAYLVLPLIGPATGRDAAGMVVDLFTNPLSFTLPKPERYAGTVTGIATKAGDRYRFASTIDSILYDSADSYAQARILYLERRRAALGGGQSDDNDDFDPYADPYGQ